MTHFHFIYSPSQREKFRSGLLVQQWRTTYPFLFDDDDERLARSQPEGHFYEWLTAILLYEATGYYSIVEYYITKSHTRKRPVFQSIVPKEIFDDIDRNQGGTPDLFVYSPETHDWFFCEVKGNKDRIRPNQKKRFEELHQLTGKFVRITTLKPIIVDE